VWEQVLGGLEAKVGVVADFMEVGVEPWEERKLPAGPHAHNMSPLVLEVLVGTAV